MTISALSIQQIVAVIRQQIASPVSKAPTSPAPVSAGATGKSSKTKASAKSRQSNLSGLIAKRVGALEKTDPDRGRKAFRIFLESILLNEFGDELINNPGFYQMIDDIQGQMEKNPDISALMQQAIAQLLSGNGPQAAS